MSTVPVTSTKTVRATSHWEAYYWAVVTAQFDAIEQAKAQADAEARGIALAAAQADAQAQFDHVNQARRQPGSTFKPFVYGAAFETGLTPGDTLFDAPVLFDRPGVYGEDGQDYPDNARRYAFFSLATVLAVTLEGAGEGDTSTLAETVP